MAKLWSGGPEYENNGEAFPLTGDSLLLADFASDIKARRALEIGCGSGIISLLTAWNNPEVNITAVDISPAAARCAQENMRLNEIDNRVEIICKDIAELEISAAGFDLVIANPPYFKEGAGKRSKPEREDSVLTLSQLSTVSARALTHGGALCIVYRAERLVDLFAVLRAGGLEPKRMRLVSHNVNEAAKLVLLEARRGGKPSLKIMAPLILKNADGGDSDEVKRIYRMK